MRTLARSVWLCGVACAWVVAGSPGYVLAQEKPPAVVPAAKSPELTTEAQRVLDRALIAYAKLKTYHDKVKLRFQMKAKDVGGGDENVDDTEQLEFWYAGPRRFTMLHDKFELYSDGHKQVGLMKETHQYVERPATDGIDEQLKSDEIGLLAETHAAAALLLEPSKYQKRFPILTEVESVKADERDGKAGMRVSGKGTLPGMPPDVPIPITMWFSDEGGLLGEMTLNMKPVYERLAADSLKVESAVGTITFDSAPLNPEISSERFVFNPGAQDKKVDRFVAPPEPPQKPDPVQGLVGKQAPYFGGPDMQGVAMTQRDFKGKVLVLFFWTLKEQPALLAMPSMQELWTEYKDKGVVVLGMNADEMTPAPDIHKVITAHGLTFRQYMDFERKATVLYQVMEVPTVVVIDGRGIVRHAQVGVAPTFKKDLAAALDKVLAAAAPAPEKKDEKK